MNNQPADLADYDDLLEYNDNENVNGAAKDADKGDGTKKILNYTGVHSSGFKDFLLKGELNRAIK